MVMRNIKEMHEYSVVPWSPCFRLPEEAITGFVVSSALIGCIVGESIAGFISMKSGRTIASS